MNFKVEIQGLKELRKKLYVLPDEIKKDPTRLGLLKGVIVAEGAAKEYIGQQGGVDVPTDEFQKKAFKAIGKTFLSDRRLRRRTDRLSSAITHRVSIEKQGFTGQVGVNVPYGAGHETGAKLKNGGTLPARPYLLAGVLKVKRQIITFLSEEWTKYLKRKGVR